MGDSKRLRLNCNQFSNERSSSRKETLQQLLKLTNEITSNFKKDKGGICQKPLNGFPDPPKRPYARSLTTKTLDGRPCAPKPYQTTQSKRRNVYQQGMAISRGPALNPTNVCYEWTDLCNKMESDRGRHFKSEDNCPCGGCTGPCSSLGPHSHRDAIDCVQDYCNYPCFEPRIANMAGNYWSGEVYTRCVYPEPCKADCFDHRPPGDYIDLLNL